MSKLAVIVTGTILCAGSMLPSQAEAMTASPLAVMRAAIVATRPVEKAACGWYPIDYPQSWAVYTRGWGCRYVYSPYYYDPYFYGPSYRVYDPPLWYRNRPYLRSPLWYSWY